MNQKHVPRRRFLASVAAATAAVPLTSPAQFGPPPGFPPMQPQFPPDTKEATLLPEFLTHVKLQQTVVWCWAATLESIFSFHGITNLPQISIVGQVWGRPTQMTSGDTFMLLGEVNRNFRLPNGKVVGLSSRILSVDLGFSEIHNGDIVAALKNRQPCVLCTISHMMVLVSVLYRGEGPNTQILAAKLMDPMGGIRNAFPAELVIANPMMSFAGGQLRFMAIPKIIKA